MCKEVAERVKMQGLARILPKSGTGSESCTSLHSDWGRKKKHPHRKPCHWALFCKICLLNMIISIPPQQEFQKWTNSRWSDVRVRGWSFKENRKKALSRTWSGVERQTKTKAKVKKIRELEKETAYDRQHWYSAKNYARTNNWY